MTIKKNLLNLKCTNLCQQVLYSRWTGLISKLFYATNSNILAVKKVVVQPKLLCLNFQESKMLFRLAN